RSANHKRDATRYSASNHEEQHVTCLPPSPPPPKTPALHTSALLCPIHHHRSVRPSPSDLMTSLHLRPQGPYPPLSIAMLIADVEIAPLP
ncbi:hypothetical protein COCVIDRAFT_114823, partial [Bipolaris victoriae FI3]